MAAASVSGVFASARQETLITRHQAHLAYMIYRPISVQVSSQQNLGVHPDTRPPMRDVVREQQHGSTLGPRREQHARFFEFESGVVAVLCARSLCDYGAARVVAPFRRKRHSL